MADFPILKWMQVDGRSVPFTYPQHQKGNGYVVTGEDNPLPTGNHVMTESGIWIPQRGTDEGAAHTQVTGSNVEDGEAIPVKQTNGISAIVRENVSITVSPGETYEVIRVSEQMFTSIFVLFQSYGLQDKWELTFQPLLDNRAILGSEIKKSVSFGTLSNFPGVTEFSVELKNIRDVDQRITRYEIGGKYFDS